MSNEKGQINFGQENQNINKINSPAKHMNLIQEESLFDIIINNYSSDNIEIEKITPKEFSELITPEIKKLLDEYEDRLDEITSDLINKNKLMGPLKFIDENNNNHFYYKGEFNNEGIINGRGIKIIPNNLVYNGDFLNGEYHGKGLLIKKGATMYGNWVNGECRGNTIFKVDGQFEYEGNFENNKKNGYGIEKYSDGSEYEGTFLDNKKSGRGIYKFSTGEIYDGNFENDLYNGEGKYIWNNETKKYEGEFKNGLIHGKGVYTYEDGTVFHGFFENGIKNGEGYIEFPDGKKYYGNWLNGELYGNGYLVCDNEKTEVIFRHGKIISANIREDEVDNNPSILSKEENANNGKKIKYNIESFFGDINSFNVNKYICNICNCFFINPIKCLGCSANFCKECIENKKCHKCNKEDFENNNDLIKEMREIVKIKCNNCEEVLDYQSSLSHFH